MGRQVLETKKILDKVSGLEKSDVGDLQETLKKGGIGFTEDMGAMLRGGDMSGLKGKIIDSMKASQAGSTFVNSPGGAAGVEGGPNAAQTLEQQVNINQQILAAMTQLAQRLGPAR
jgi:DNA uptake protein ComE-like DNA-binding protein